MAFAQDFPQQRAIMRVYSAYRIILAGMILIALLFGPATSTLGSTAPIWFAIAVIGYTLFALLTVLIHTVLSTKYTQTQLFFEFFVDIGVIMIMSYCSGSADSGLPLLLIVTISAASIIMPGQLCMAIAALATISVIGEVASHMLTETVSAQRFIVAGMTGTAYFSTAIAIRYLSSRIVKTQQLAERRGTDIEQLSRINQRIVQRMQTGIVVMSQSGKIKLINAAATELLDIPTPVTDDNHYVPPVLIDMARKDSNSAKVITIGSKHLDIHVNMSILEQDNDSDRLLYIENISKINHRAQNLKLASLGRLTASIAHEIRNPLSAISHAAQLLAESPDLQAGDQRFAAIIQNHALRMNNTIKNILELSRGRTPEPTRFCLSTWLDQFLEDWQPTSHIPLDIKIQPSQNDFINVDRSQLSQIVSNIAENGVRHGAEINDKALLLFRCETNPVSGVVTLDIIDNGLGISADNQDKIFEPFFTTQKQGNGLGLYLCRELCLANQIHIYYRRTSDGKSCFRLQFSHPDRGTLAE
ncbi:Signal transduction histidine-protein kinase AtoS [Zhongshania aliphaticivorans]|uniref:histidine kinase n=1 Tax=Zhongshania aliphaticivorans TaxID=1470434 RepID=A0A5S9PXE2_9GAMM|nr:ATP-binding protein [Zhongshania aliphaticivorans]CAA0109366.1 Signal transduction histidine-protein kinase AtoS [Zhongshania aliphaticivorans]CAA0117588.1 Signal transduction histidine-protein kinase AtoS [Zhongshania aliphaticivorans]